MPTKIPILKIADNLVASIQVELDDRSIVQFQTDLLDKVVETGATGVVVDITAVDLVDSFMARALNDTAVAVHLLGTEMVIVGMQPPVAITLVEMGLTMPNALTALNLEMGLELLHDKLNEERSGHQEPAGRDEKGSSTRNCENPEKSDAERS